MEMGPANSQKSRTMQLGSPRMLRLQQSIIDSMAMQFCLSVLAVAYCIACVTLVDDSLGWRVNACMLLNVTGWLVVGVTASEFLIRVMAQAGHLYLFSTWRMFFKPLYHKVEICILIYMLVRVIMSLWNCEQSSAEDNVELIDRLTIFFVLVYRGLRSWGIMYGVSVLATEKASQRTQRLHAKQVRLDEALWPEDFKEDRRRYRNRAAVRAQDFLNKRQMQLPIVAILLAHGIFYIMAMEYAPTVPISWVDEAVEMSGYLAICVLLMEFIVRCIARDGEPFFLPILHKAEALFLCVGGFLVLYATLNNRWIRTRRGGWTPDAWATLSVLVVHRLIRFFGIAIDVSESEYGVSSVLDAKAIKIFLSFVGTILEVSPQNVHFKIPSPTQKDIEVWILKARLKSDAFESLHLPVALHGGLVEELLVRLPRPRFRAERARVEDTANVRVQNLLLLFGPGEGLAEAGGCSGADEAHYWCYENILETKWRLVELISIHLGHFVSEEQPSSKEGEGSGSYQSDNQCKVAESTPLSNRGTQTNKGRQDKRRTYKSARVFIQERVQSRIEKVKKNFGDLFKDLSSSHIVVSIDNVMLQYEDAGSGLCDRRATIGVKVGNISIHRHQDHHITCDATRFRVFMKVDRSSRSSDEDVGFWWERSDKRLSALLKKNPGDAVKKMRQIDRREWFRSWFFEGLDRKTLPSDRQLHQRIERWPERYEVISFLMVGLVGRPKAIIRFFCQKGELHLATILRVRECKCRECLKKQGIEDLPDEFNMEKHVMTHQIRFLVGASGERWVTLNESTSLLTDESGDSCFYTDTSCVYSSAKENKEKMGHCETTTSASSWTPLKNSNDVRRKSREQSEILREKRPATRATIVHAIRKSLWGQEEEKKETPTIRSWVYTVEATPIRLTCDSHQISYLNDWCQCLKAWFDHDNAFRWRPDWKAIPDSSLLENDRKEVRSMTARLWWIYATHRVLARNGKRFQTPGLVEVAWRSTNRKKYSELIAEVAKRSKGDYQAMQWQPSEKELAKELQVRLSLGAVVEARRTVLQEVLTKLARERDERILQEKYSRRYNVLASLKTDQGLFGDMAQQAAEKAENLEVVVDRMGKDAYDETAQRMQSVGTMLNSNLDVLRTTMSQPIQSMTSLKSSKPRRMIRFMQADSDADSEESNPRVSTGAKLMSLFRGTTRSKSADNETLCGDDYSEDSEVGRASTTSRNLSCRLKSVASAFLPTLARKSTRSSDVSGSDPGSNYSSQQPKESHQTPNPPDFMAANLAGEWQFRVQGIYMKLLRSCEPPSPRPVILNAKASGLVVDLGILLPAKLDAFKTLTTTIENEYMDLALLPYTGLFVIEDMSVVCPEAKKLAFYGRRDLCNIVRPLRLPPAQKDGFLTGSAHSALRPMPATLVFAAHMSTRPDGKDANCKVIMHSADMWFVLYEPVLKLFWDYLFATAIPSYQHQVSLAASSQIDISDLSRNSSGELDKSLPPASFRKSTGNFIAFDRRFGPLSEEVEVEVAKTLLKPSPDTDIMHEERYRLKGMVSRQRFFERLVGRVEHMLDLDIHINLGAMHVAQVGSYFKPGFVLVEEYRIHPCTHRACRGVSRPERPSIGKTDSSGSASSSVGSSDTAVTMYDSMKITVPRHPSFERFVSFESDDFPDATLLPWGDPKWSFDKRRMSEMFQSKIEDAASWSDPVFKTARRPPSYMQLSFQGGMHSHANAKVQSPQTHKRTNRGLDGIAYETVPKDISPHVCDASASCSCTVSAQVPSSLVSVASSRNGIHEHPHGHVVAESRYARSVPDSAFCCCSRSVSKASPVTATHEEEPFWLLSVLPSRTSNGRPHWTTCYADSRHVSRETNSPVMISNRRQLPAPPARSSWATCELCSSGIEQIQITDLEERNLRSKNDEDYLQLPGPPQCVYSRSSEEGSTSTPRGHDFTHWQPAIDMLIRAISSKDFASGWLEREAMNWCLRAGRGTAEGVNSCCEAVVP